MLIQARDARSRPCRRAFARGFTLIELLVTLTLMGILMAVAMPAFSTWIRNAQVRTVTDALQTGIRTAQAEATRRNRGMVFFLTNGSPGQGSSATALAGGKNWQLQTITQNDDSSTPEFVAGGKLSDVASTVQIAGSGGINALCFNSNGYLFAPTSASLGGSGATCSAQNATFDISQPNPVSGVDRPLRVQVRIGGQLRTCDPTRTFSSDASTASPTSGPDGC